MSAAAVPRDGSGHAAKTVTTLVVGGRASEREAAIAAALTPALTSAVIIEGLSDGRSILADLLDSAVQAGAGAVTVADTGTDSVVPQVIRIAPGCLCCAGSMILRVNLNRLLRRPPEQLFISLANAEHVAVLRAWLSAPPYDQWLALGDDLHA